MKIKTIFIIDSINQLNPKKDSSIAMMQAAASHHWDVYFATLNDLSVLDGTAFVNASKLEINASIDSNWFTIINTQKLKLQEFPIIFMRKEPPFDLEYIYATYILELAEKLGSVVVNKPQALRDANEKMFITHFPDCTPLTLVTRNKDDIKGFLNNYRDIIIKPLDGMGGSSIFRIQQESPNVNVIIETLTNHGQRYAMVQKYIAQVLDGDKRILIVNGKAIDYLLARIPAEGETRANLAAGATGVVRKLGEAERKIVAKVAPVLLKKGILFAGLDIIGSNLTEINITCPTCIKEIYADSGINAADVLIESLESKLAPNLK